MSSTTEWPDAEVFWHDAECGAYGADLPLWERLASERAGPVLELGAGTGRVALHLATRGHRVVALDRDQRLLDALDARARTRGLEVETVCAPASELTARVGQDGFGLIAAPMQFLQLLDPAERHGVLAATARALLPGGLLAAPLLDERRPLRSGPTEPLPDVREVDGWIHSSLPLEVAVEDDTVTIHRLRQLVSPAGELTDEQHLVRLTRVSPACVEAEAEREGGLRALPRIELAETADHVGSVVVCLERPR
jgi:SAM-dependent methyltransferase